MPAIPAPAALALPDLTALAEAMTGAKSGPALLGRAPPLPRLISIWEITSWILPMAPEHLRRVLAAEPDLPQGATGVEGGTRWFTPADVAALRARFGQGGRKRRYHPHRPPGALAPLITLTQPQGGAGKSTAALHLATAAALAGYRVLLIDADAAAGPDSGPDSGPGGGVTQALLASPAHELGVLGLIARAAALHLRQGNEARMDRGEAPLAMDAVLNTALTLQAADLIRPTQWPGLDLLPAAPGLMQADLQIGRWRMAQPRWQPWQALAQALTSDGLRRDYDLILCDTGRGLGPLALSMLASADVLLAPLPLVPGALNGLGAGIAALSRALGMLEAEARMTAQALGQTAQPMQWRGVAVLPTRAGQGAAALLASTAARLGATVLPATVLPATVLPAALPEIPQIAAGRAAQFYDLDYRDVGRLVYAPQRDAIEAAWRGVADLLTGLWAADSAGHGGFAAKPSKDGSPAG